MEEIVGHWWDRVVTRLARREFPQAAVQLAEVTRPVAMMFRALGGDGGLRIAAASAAAHGARRSWLARLASTGTHVELAWRDHEALYLPSSIAVYNDATLNRELYLWLAALAAVDSDDSGDWLTRNRRAAQQVLTRFPGFQRRYARLVVEHLAQRPDPAGLAPPDAAQERAIQAALRDPAAETNPVVASRPPQPVPLWLHPHPPHTAPSAPQPDGGDSATRGGGGARDRRRRQAERAAMPDGRDGMLLYRFEGIFGLADYVPVKRGTEDDEDAGNAQAIADDMDSLSIARDGASVAASVRFDLDLPAAENDDTPLGPGILLPEWDYRSRTLKSDYCMLQPLLATRAAPAALPAALRSPARRLRRQFEALTPAPTWVNARPEGVEPDLDAWLRHATERARGQLTAEPHLYRDFRRGRRDLSCLLLADLSLSTDSWVNNDARVIDVVRDTLFLFSEALAASGDRFALYGFSSRRREHVRFHHIKGFNERYTDAVRGRIAVIKPGYYTRMGAAIRQATRLLGFEAAGRRLLLILTDGKPNDLDLYEGRYGVEDTRAAVQAARAAGLTPFCVTIDEEAADYLPHVFGIGSYMVVRRPADLPKRLPLLYARLTQS